MTDPRVARLLLAMNPLFHLLGLEACWRWKMVRTDFTLSEIHWRRYRRKGAPQ